MEENCNKIILVCLNQQIALEVGRVLSCNLDMMFCSAKDLIEYELIDVNTLKNIASTEYLNKAEHKVLQHIASFENVVVAIDYQLLCDNINILNKNSVIVFIKIPINFLKDKQKIEKIMFNQHTLKLEKVANLCVETKTENAQKICEQIIIQLGGIL